MHLQRLQYACATTPTSLTLWALMLINTANVAKFVHWLLQHSAVPLLGCCSCKLQPLLQCSPHAP